VYDSFIEGKKWVAQKHGKLWTLKSEAVAQASEPMISCALILCTVALCMVASVR